jgi:putative membrane protein
MEPIIKIQYITSAIVFSVIGIIVLTIAFIIFDRLTPGNLWKEVVEKQNIALAIVASAMMLALSQIIASAIHG